MHILSSSNSKPIRKNFLYRKSCTLVPGDMYEKVYDTKVCDRKISGNDVNEANVHPWMESSFSRILDSREDEGTTAMHISMNESQTLTGGWKRQVIEK